MYVCIPYCQSLQLLCPLWVLNWSIKYSYSYIVKQKCPNNIHLDLEINVLYLFAW